MEKHVERLDDHEERISVLELSYGKLEGKFNDLEMGQLSLSNTVLKEFSSTKDMLNAQNKTNATLLDHMYGIKTAKMTSKKEIILALLGGGGIVGILASVVAFWDQIGKVFGN